jgi:hypothetical protein
MLKAPNSSKDLHREAGHHVSPPVGILCNSSQSSLEFGYSRQNRHAFAPPRMNPLHIICAGEGMVIFKCPYCGAGYEVTTAHLAFQQRSYAKCQVCYRTMYSWASRNVPLFTLMNASEGAASDIKP